MSDTYRVTIITGIGPYYTPDKAEGVVLARSAFRYGLPFTLTHGTGFHPKWGSEPVLVITGFADEQHPPLYYSDFAEDLREVFSQDSVLYHAEPTRPFELL
jgi:hypothetical protein